MSKKSESAETRQLELIGGREKRVLEIHEYDARWPDIYERHASVIQKTLGDIVLQIEHIGSTSVPGLAAKAIIDILLVLDQPQDEAKYLPALQAAGYELRVREPAFDEHRMLRTPERDVHIHIYPPQSKEIGRYLAFRDRLRDDADDRAAYEQAKRLLAGRDWEDMNDYADAKSEIVEAIIARGLRDVLV